MTRAANELGVAQPSLSNSIRGLETELGVDLFDRHGRNVRLNSFGRAFLRHVDRAFSALDDGRKELHDISSTRQSEIAVSSAALGWAVGLFTAFSEKRPDVRFRLFQRSTGEMTKQLGRSEVDLCLMIDVALEAIQWTPLVSGEIYAMLPPGHRLTGRSTVSMAELRDEPLVVPRTGIPVRDLIEACLSAEGFVPNIVCECDEMSTMGGLVRAGLGLQFIPDLGRDLSTNPDPSIVRISSPDCVLRIGMAWPRSGYRSSAAKDFSEFALAYFETKRQDR